MLGSRLSVPQPRQPLVVRQRLLDLLSRGVRRPLTVVHGPAGSGKTVLVASWATSERLPGPLAWVTLDSDVDAPGPFWAYVLDALHAIGLPARDDIGVPARAEAIDRTFLARVAAALSELGEPVVLVLDDHDQVSPGPIDRDLEFVLRNAAPYLRLIILGRRQPSLRLARYRAAGDLTEIGPADLAFTPSETDVLLQQHGVPLPADSVDDLTTRTEGWVTGLRLSALALQRGTRPRDLRLLLAAGQGDVAEFLLAEVLDEEPTETQDLLLRTCLLERVNGEVADALTGRSDGQQRLHDLALAGSFVRPVPGAGGWFSYHEIFAQAVRSRLVLRHSDLVPQIHRRASTWLADHGWLTEAVAHAVAAEDWNLAAEVVVDHLAIGHLLVGLDAHRLSTLFAALPADVTTAPAALVRAALAMSRFEAAACVEELDSAAAAVAEVADPRRRDAVRLGIAAVRVIVSRLTGDLAAGEAAGAEARALMEKQPRDQLAAHPELPALVLSSLGTLQLWGGSLDAAQRSLEEGLSVAVGPATEYAKSNCLGQLALIDCLRGRLRRAHAGAMEALRLVDRAALSTTTRVPVGHVAAAAIAWEWHDLSAVRMHVEHAASSVAAQHDPSTAVLVAQLRARYRLAHGDGAGAVQIIESVADRRAQLPAASFVHAPLLLDEALAWLTAGHPDRATSTLHGLPVGSPELCVGLARVRLATGQPTEALAALEEMRDEPGRSPALAIRAQLAAAQSVLALERPGDARRRVELALRLAREEGFRQPFAEAGPWLRHLLTRDRGLTAAHRWLGAELTGEVDRGAGSEDPPPLVAQPLTDRELEILRLVAQPMSSREVAETLHLSPNTVKTHLSSVYRKLAAPTRNQAVRRARTLGIL